MNFSSLNNDALVEIFIRLPVTERLVLESVCRKWQEVMPYTDLKSIFLSDYSFDMSQKGTFYENMGHWTMSYQILEQKTLKHFFEIFLIRCGKFLENFDLCVQNGGKFRILLDRDLLETIGSNFPEIRHLNLAHSFVRVDALETLISSFPKLQTLNLLHVMFADTEYNRPTRYLHEIKEPLDRLVNDHPSLHTVFLHNLRFLVSFENPQLRALINQKCHHLRDTDLDQICSECPNIETVDLSGCSRLVYPAASLVNLEHLKQLNISDTAVCDGGFAKICRYCPNIENLDIQRCSNLTQFYPLLLLDKLSHLKVGPSPAFCDDILIDIAMKETLLGIEIVQCPITDKSLAVVAKKNPELKNLKLSTTITGDALPLLIKNCQKLERLLVYQAVTSELCNELAELSYLKVFDFAGYFDVEWIRKLANRRKQRLDDGETFRKLWLGFIWSESETQTAEFQAIVHSAKIGKWKSEI